MEIHLETINDKLTNKLERNIRNIKNSVDLSRIKLLEKIAKLEIFFKEDINQSCRELKEVLEDNIISEGVILSNLKKPWKRKKSK